MVPLNNMSTTITHGKIIETFASPALPASPKQHK
jgi:hypothetical protein